jgi:hypothetical protein
MDAGPLLSCAVRNGPFAVGLSHTASGLAPPSQSTAQLGPRSASRSRLWSWSSVRTRLSPPRPRCARCPQFQPTKGPSTAVLALGVEIDFRGVKIDVRGVEIDFRGGSKSIVVSGPKSIFVSDPKPIFFLSDPKPKRLPCSEIALRPVTPAATGAAALGLRFRSPPPSPIRFAGFWAGWWPWCISTPPRPVREAREDGGGGRQPRRLTALGVAVLVQAQPDQDSH